MSSLVFLAMAACVLAGLGLLVMLRRRLAASLRHLERQSHTLAEQAALLDLAHDAIVVWDLTTGAIRFWNRGAEEMYGWPAADVLGKTPQAILDTKFPKPLQEINAELTQAGHWEGELRHTRRDGTTVIVSSRWALQRDSSGTPQAVMGINTDITSRKQFEAALEHQARHDALTGLPNRSLFVERVESALAMQDRRKQRAAVMFIDVDNFKVVNDSLGHQAGDMLLVEVANRLRACVRGTDLVARLGGDEFTVLLTRIVQDDEAEVVANRIMDALRTPVTIADRDIYISASLGVALSGNDLCDATTLLRSADLAMYQSKSGGKARFSIFDARLRQDAMERLELETALRGALEHDELRVHYQPIHTLSDGQLTEVEALVRWDRPGHDLMYPASFISIAEETGLIVPIGRWVLEQACSQALSWPDLVVSVNLSARQFRDPGLLDDISRILGATGLPATRLKLEITESLAIFDMEGTVAKLHALKALGVRLAIDDFGTGYSWLTYLKRLPIDTLKIDRSFIDGIDRDLQDAAIVQSVVALARTLDLDVIGEGVESQAQAAHLRALGCDRGQGYLFARPLPAESITAMLLDRTSLTAA